MSNSRAKLLEAAASLFAAQGITTTTTKQIGELAAVNEVTLFRQFGNKHGLLLALMEKGTGAEERSAFDRFCQSLASQVSPHSDRTEFLRSYIQACLQASIATPALLLSAIGEATQYPLANRQAIAQGLQQIDRQLASYLERWPSHANSSPEQLASLLHRLVFGYALLELVSSPQTDQDFPSQANFIQDIIDLLTPKDAIPTAPPTLIADIPSPVVHQILQQAQRQDPQTFAWVYLLFAAGLAPTEVVKLRRSQYISDREQQFLQITGDFPRQVPINQWILGKRYGTYQKNPLTQWLRGRKDDRPELFLDIAAGRPLTIADLQERWQQAIAKIEVAIGRVPSLEQTQQTWCIEMLVKGLSVPDLSLLLGWEESQLIPYERRAREKIALEKAIELDKKPT
jgi:AcrR family transcriptional regulator